MSGNHVEQLESRVRELEATIDGLTDELLDTKDRLETVETAIDDGERTEGRGRTRSADGELLGEEEKADRTANAEIAEEAERERASDDPGTGGSAAEAGEAEEIAESEEEMDGIIVA